MSIKMISKDLSCSYTFRLIKTIPVVGSEYITKEGISETIIEVTEMDCDQLICMNSKLKYRCFIIMTSKNGKYDNSNFSVWFVAIIQELPH